MQALMMFSSMALCFDSAFTTGVPGGTCEHQYRPERSEFRPISYSHHNIVNTNTDQKPISYSHHNKVQDVSIKPSLMKPHQVHQTHDFKVHVRSLASVKLELC